MKISVLNNDFFSNEMEKSNQANYDTTTQFSKDFGKIMLFLNKVTIEAGNIAVLLNIFGATYDAE